MGKGSGAGRGVGEGVTGAWRVSAFLLFLTGWQAVLLPWSPLILKDAGFSATSVGLLSGATTLAASVGVVACLRAMRRSRSGAVRRLLLWLLFASATFLQCCGVVFLLQYIPHTGLVQSCVNGWSFAPTTAVFHLNMSIPSAVSPQGPQSLAPKANTTTAPIPSNISVTTTTTSTSTTISPVHFSPTPPNTTTTLLATTTTAQAAIVPTVAFTSTSRPSHVTASVVQTTQTPNDKIPVNSSVTTVQPLDGGYVEESEEGHPEGEGGEAAAAGGTVAKAPHTPLVRKEKFKPAHKSKGKSSHKNAHKSHDSPNNRGRDKTHHMTTTHRNQSPHDADQPPLEENYSEDDTFSQDFDEEEDDNETVDGDYDIPLDPNNYSRSRGASHLPSSGLQDDERVSGATQPWKYQPRRPQNRQEATVPDHRDDNVMFSNNISPNGKSASLMNDQVTTGPRLSHSPTHHLKETRPLHHLAWSSHPEYAPKAETHVVTDHPDDDWQHDDRGDQVKSHSSKHKRSRRSVHHIDSGVNAPAAKVDANETVPHSNKTSVSIWKSMERVKDTGLQAGVAVLLVLGGLLGAGVEPSVAQLWHCYVHGYDEGGVSQDVLQRTITHTFHLSAYASHKSWTGISSGGWAMAAGVVSIMACWAGAGGSGYGGLLGMHLTLGLASLLVLLILPVPYGSIDPPRTRRPLSLYLDDEVLREGVRRLTFHLWVFVNGCLAALSLTFSLWLLQEMTTEGWLVGSQAASVGLTLVSESLALHTQRRLVTRWGLHGLMGVCGTGLMLHYGFMWASENVGMVVVAHVGLGVAMAFLWVAVTHNALLLATVSDQEREAWASWWCWRFGLGVGAAVWGVGVSGAGGRVRPLLLPAALVAATLASVLFVTAVLSRRHSRTRRRVYHTLDLDMADEEDDVEEDAAEDDWLVKRAKKEGIIL